MIIKTYTNMWNVERKFYNVYDIKLPTPISFRQLGLFFGSMIVWIPLMVALNVPFSPPFGYLVWIAPPVALTILGNKQIFEGKTLLQYGKSVIGYYLRPHTYTGMKVSRNFGKPTGVTANVWQRSSVAEKVPTKQQKIKKNQKERTLRTAKKGK